MEIPIVEMTGQEKLLSF